MNVCLYMAPLIAALSGGVQASDALRKEASTLFGRIEPPTNELRSRADVVLGRALFWDVRLSADGKTACASCHLARDWGADRRPFPIDARGKPLNGSRDAESVKALRAALRKDGVYLTELRESRGGAAGCRPS